MRILLTGVLLALAAGAARADDIIKFKNPNREDARGEVVAGNYKMLEYDIFFDGTRARQKTEVGDIAEIILDQNRFTFDFSSGKSQMERGDFAGAARRFERVKKDPRASNFLKQTAAINVVRCLYAGGKFKEVEEAIKTLRRQRPDTYFLRESYDLEYKAAVARGDAAGVARAVEGLKQRAKAGNLRGWIRDAELMQGRVLELQGNWREALKLHQKYAQDKEAGTEAMLGELRCLAALKNWGSLGTRAGSHLKRVEGRRGVSGQIMTALYNARATSELHANQYRKSFLNYMRGVSVYGRGVVSDENEVATSGAAIACAKYSTTLKDAAKRTLYLTRAKELFAEYLRKYDDRSKLAAEVRKAIKDAK